MQQVREVAFKLSHSIRIFMGHRALLFAFGLHYLKDEGSIQGLCYLTLLVDIYLWSELFRYTFTNTNYNYKVKNNGNKLLQTPVIKFHDKNGLIFQTCLLLSSALIWMWCTMLHLHIYITLFVFMKIYLQMLILMLFYCSYCFSN